MLFKSITIVHVNMVLFSYFKELHVDLLPELAVAIHDMKSVRNVRCSGFVCRTTSIIEWKEKITYDHLQWKWKFHLFLELHNWMKKYDIFYLGAICQTISKYDTG